MNLEYIVKKCRGFGYATNFQCIKTREITKNKNVKLYYFHDPTVHVDFKNAESYDDLDKFYNYISELDKNDPLFDQESIFFVDVGVMDLLSINKPVEIPPDDLKKIVDEIEIPDDIGERNKNEFRIHTKLLIDNPKQYLNKDFTEAFLNFLIDLYPKINDSKLQQLILQILVYNRKNCSSLLKNHPIQFTKESKKMIRYSKMFSDLKITDPYFEKSELELNIERINGIDRDLTLTTISKFNGFSNTFSRVDNNKKRANIPDINILRNHEPIHMLARGRIVSTPVTNNKLSVHKLMEIFEKFNNFHVIYLYPNYQNNFAYNSMPTKNLEIDPSNGCVILIVFFRFMLLRFFGLHCVMDSTDKFAKYTI